jgi:hypothetical protein
VATREREPEREGAGEATHSARDERDGPHADMMVDSAVGTQDASLGSPESQHHLRHITMSAAVSERGWLDRTARA